MRFLRNRTVGHRSGLKPFHNGFHTFHLINWNTAFFIITEINQITQMDGLIFSIQCMSVLLKGLIITGSCSLLQQVDGNRIIQMLLLSRTHLMAANTVQSQIHIQSKWITSLAISSSVIPPTRLTVFVKYLSITSLLIPMASKIWEPW